MTMWLMLVYRGKASRPWCRWGFVYPCYWWPWPSGVWSDEVAPASLRRRGLEAGTVASVEPGRQAVNKSKCQSWSWKTVAFMSNIQISQFIFLKTNLFKIRSLMLPFIWYVPKFKTRIEESISLLICKVILFNLCKTSQLVWYQIMP